MTIPTAEEFKDAIAALKSADASSMHIHLNRDFFLHDSDLSVRLANDVFHERASRAKFAMALPAGRWLAEQRTFLRAASAAFRSRRGSGRTTREAARSLARALQSAAAFGPETFQRRVNLVCNFRPTKTIWTGRVLEHLNEYFHEDAPAALQKRKAALPGHLKRVHQGIASLQVLLEDRNQYSGRKDVEVEILRQATVLASSLNKDTIFPPIERFDRTARVRILIWRLTTLNLRLVRGRGVAAIRHLLELDGVESEWTERQLEKQCAQYEHWERQRLQLRTHISGQLNKTL
ncbi:hypothetical protein RAS12_12010 [Achromobacter seleniivolatilans]|uniref:CHAD domain-containing protein n=1 Tax=Achromobacter seleniivolatilans TaxID=3047478 RepID=A0ABY9M7Q5_9BURK|nr:hypothetical protein [Achromobacter sp. R39]WMD23062.1 hypothetical protein RAS12_12010 [Achromobacter sp. R39]